MENNFNNRDFEQFVKQNADQYRMFPSEKVWNGIHNTLHTRKKWYGIGLGLLLLTTGVVTWVMLNTPGKNRQVVSTIPETVIQPPEVNKKPVTEIVIVPPVKAANSKTSFITPPENLQENLYIPARITESVDPENITSVTPETVYNNPEPAVVKAPVQNQTDFTVKTASLPAKEVITNPSISTASIAAKANDYSFSIKPDMNTAGKKTVPAPAEEKTIVKNELYPLTIESVVNSYTHIPKKKKISLQVYFSPTISYRELKENKAFINSARNANSVTGGTNAPTSTYSADVNSSVTHKPDAGLQLGFSAGYPLTNNLKIIGGLQFNISKYDIRANSHPVELTTIALSNANGRTNTVYTLTNYRNDDGNSKVNWLHNLYFSASAPIGLELKLLGSKKSYFGVSGTVQPSFILSNRAYLLSTDYKNYAEMPSLIRKWNINTGFEMFAGYTTGKLKWRVGPQIRYQVMSSFVKKYPVQEHLFDFGLKLGIMLNK